MITKDFVRQISVTMLLCMVAIPMTAHDIEVANSDGVTIYYTYINNNTELQVSYQGSFYYSYSNEYTGNVVIPQNVTYSGKSYPVTNIGNNAFSNCNGLTSVTIPNSVTSIGNNAFSYCNGLTSVTTPNSVTSIGNNAFQGCSGLTSITIPNSVTSIGNNAFQGCSGLTSITIPNSVTSIGDYAFYGCSGLTSMIVETGNTVYDSRNDCNAIIKTATNELITGCQNTVIPNSVTSIENNAFSSCNGLTSVTIPNSVTSIGDYAFSNCSDLTLVSIPNSVISIGSSTFAGCTHMADMYCYSKQLPTTGNNVFYVQGSAYIQNATLHVPASALNDYKATAPWSGFGTIVPIDEEEEDDLQNYLNSFTDTEDVLTATTYTRQFKNTEWQSLYVPFSLSYDQWSPYFEVARLTGVSNTDGEHSPYKTIGTGSITDNFWFKATAPVVIARNTENPNKYRLMAAFDALGKAVGMALDGNQEPYIELQLLKPGDTFYEVEITQDGLVGYTELNTGYYHSSYDADVYLLYPGHMASLRSQEAFSYNYVVEYLEDGTPGRIQLAPFYYMFGIGGWNKTALDNIVIIDFPGYISKDYSHENASLGISTDECVPYADGNTQIEATLLTADDGDLLANTPYLIRAKKTGKYTISFDASQLSEQKENTQTLDNLLVIKGNYSQRTGLKSLGFRCMLGGSLWYPTADDYVLPPFRWYAYPYRLRIVRNSPIQVVIRDGAATGISAKADVSGHDGRHTVYNLSGRRLEADYLLSLPKGIYIIDGKKYTVK